ncbi:MAG: BMP family ABC transporter substrate-binding protein [Lachnospiraceae bacterium]|nr:BMP family ABC transporter substrate-binding protein [Lachnospiraceae bacterium]
MNLEEYIKAKRAGEKEYDYCVSKGIHPYLVTLDDMLSRVQVESRVKLGLTDIPMEKIVGTYNEGRSNAFARNFMPLLDKDSEFAMKWANLYESMEAEGLRDPIIAYEFLDQYYVQEGNKRVSVSRCMGAVTIEGYVTRIIPKKSDAKEIQMYYEFLDFYDKTQINYLSFSKEGSYTLLLKATYDNTDQVWDDTMKADFRSAYIAFSKEFLAKGGNKLALTVSDAFLVYLSIFGYAEAKEALAAEFRDNIGKIWNEFELYSRRKTISISLNPITEPKKHTLSMLMSPKSYAAAWVYEKPKEISAWTYAHEMGREYVDDVFGKQINTDAVFGVSVSEAAETMEKLIADGYNILFTTSPQFFPACAKVAVEHPDVKVLNCSLNLSSRHVRSYYLRMYEAKFMIGALAGALASDDRIGYVADYPIYGVTASINAFALGARMVNPKAEVYLEWSTVKGSAPKERFREKGITLISSRDLNAPASMSREFGLFRRNGEDVAKNYALPVWHWGKMYEDILRTILNGNWKDEEESAHNRALNYWWGMSAGAIDVIYSDRIPTGTKLLLKILRASLTSGGFNPFSGLLKFRDGSQIEAGDGLSPEDILRMDKLLYNIHGSIPTVDEISDEYRAFIEAQGIFRPEADTHLSDASPVTGPDTVPVVHASDEISQN